MAVTLTTLESNLQTKLNATSGTTDAQEFLLLSKSVEALNPSIAVQDVIDEGTTQVGLVQTEGATQVAAVQSAASGYVTQSDIDASVSALVDSAPATLDTLNELAAALGDDANFSTTVTNSIATKMPISGGVFTGGVVVTGTLSADDTFSIESSSGYANIEMGGPSGAYIDMKSPMSDDYDGRIQYDSGSFRVITNSDTPIELRHNATTRVATTSTGADVTGTLTTDGVTVDGTLDIEEVYEKFNSSASTTGTLAYETNAYGILYLTANQTANRTINFTNVNANLATGQTLTCTVLATQGSTAYYLNAYQVDGTTVTPKWSGGSAPTAGNASGIDVYTFTIIKTADATFTVLASQTQYA